MRIIKLPLRERLLGAKASTKDLKEEAKKAVVTVVA
jgi:hypothetical protein